MVAVMSANVWASGTRSTQASQSNGTRPSTSTSQASHLAETYLVPPPHSAFGKVTFATPTSNAMTAKVGAPARRNQVATRSAATFAFPAEPPPPRHSMTATAAEPSDRRGTPREGKMPPAATTSGAVVGERFGSQRNSFVRSAVMRGATAGRGMIAAISFNTAALAVHVARPSPVAQ